MPKKTTMNKSNVSSKKPDIKNMILAAFFAAITVLCAQIAVPAGPVPFTLSIVGVFFKRYFFK